MKYLGYPGKAEALEISRQMTRSFSQKYDNAIWNATLASIRVPAFDKSASSASWHGALRASPQSQDCHHEVLGLSRQA